PLWRSNASNVAAAEAREKQATAALEAARREVELKVLTSAQRYASRRDEMGRWRDDSVKAFREAAELADRHYRLGAVPATTYVELQKQYLEAVETLLDTRRDALSAAIDLEQATGLRLADEGTGAEGGSR
ncbi:MAG: TolC family protein, partial [Verrucomicrobiota bacterium]